MRKQTIRCFVAAGVGCAVLMAAAVWYSITFNESRLVEPMDFSTYVFRPQDLPMILACAAVAAYALCLAAAVVRTAFRARRSPADAAYTRRVDPRLGWLGLLGFLGFGGFWTYGFNKTVFPVLFFLFFGSFGFFYEGRLSHTFMDERFRENQMKAQLAASRTALGIIFLATVLLGRTQLMDNLEHTFIAYLIAVSLALALWLFLSEYLLYHYDQDGDGGESGD